ncbi:hypothetical protein ILUMI_24535 [Ignelater luminosus]|uniref:DUF4371 domain-containing protein n=1 Tax=Ignelater luminosus TaxID=2038154 RepID=A0A8K0C6Z4_IGNLU|nr:hypothetical protein ILUMI_24535 [Ignelater luminosus]
MERPFSAVTRHCKVSDEAINLAFRGHRENLDAESSRGNLLELVNLLAKYDPVSNEHLTKIKLGNTKIVTYLSFQIQNEFINVLGDQVRKKIIQAVKETKYFCIVFDSTPNVSRTDQTSQILRYVKIEGFTVAVVESFVDFLETEGKNAKQVAKMIMEKIDEAQKNRRLRTVNMDFMETVTATFDSNEPRQARLTLEADIDMMSLFRSPHEEVSITLSKIITAQIQGSQTTGIYDWEVQGVNKEAISTSVFKTTDLKRYKTNCPNTNAVPPEVATAQQEIDCYSTDTVPSEIAANPTATVPQEVVSCLTDAVPPGKAPLQIEQASTSTVANPPGVASTFTGVCRKSFEELLLDMLEKEKKPETPDKKRKRLVTNCEIITSKEYPLKKNNEQTEKQKKANRKKLKQTAKEEKKELEKVNISKPDARNKIKRKKPNNTDDETSEESDQLSVRDSDDDYDFMSRSDEEIDKHDVNSIQVGEYYVVKV